MGTIYPRCSQEDCRGYPNKFGICKHCTKKRSIEYREKNFNICKIIGCHQMFKKEKSFCRTHENRPYYHVKDGIYLPCKPPLTWKNIYPKLVNLNNYFFILRSMHGKNTHLKIVNEIFVVNFGLWVHSVSLYGPIRFLDVPDKAIINIDFLEKNNIKKQKFEEMDRYTLRKKINFAIEEHIILIQRAWRKCRYDSKYLMCRRVQLRGLADIGAIDNKDIP